MKRNKRQGCYARDVASPTGPTVPVTLTGETPSLLLSIRLLDSKHITAGHP